MTDAIYDFEAKLDEYAELLVRVGLNVQAGQTVLLRSDVVCADLSRLCAKKCYEAGAAEVVLSWSDTTCDRLRYLYGVDSIFDEVGLRTQGLYDDAMQGRWTSLRIIGEDPEYLEGVDPNRIMRQTRAVGKANERFFKAQTSMEFQWLVAACPTKAWAKKVFPRAANTDEALSRLWDAVFATVSVTGDGRSQARWEEKTALCEARAKRLNEFDFVSLHYTNSLGTDLMVGLPEGHFWSGARERAQNGYEFIANMPTEEIYTLPHKDRVNGRVYASKPLVLDGNLVEDFYFEIQDGHIIEAHAKVGEDYLHRSLAKDEGSSYLGEVALVPYDSPINNTGVLFYSTLFDENASCHFAFGNAYPRIRGAEKLSEAELCNLGVNRSINHVDFMVGTKDLSVVGVTHDGGEIRVFKDGNFAF